MNKEALDAIDRLKQLLGDDFIVPEPDKCNITSKTYLIKWLSNPNFGIYMSKTQLWLANYWTTLGGIAIYWDIEIIDDDIEQIKLIATNMGWKKS